MLPVPRSTPDVVVEGTGTIVRLRVRGVTTAAVLPVPWEPPVAEMGGTDTIERLGDVETSRPPVPLGVKLGKPPIPAELAPTTNVTEVEELE